MGVRSRSVGGSAVGAGADEVDGGSVDLSWGVLGSGMRAVLGSIGGGVSCAFGRRGEDSLGVSSLGMVSFVEVLSISRLCLGGMVSPAQGVRGILQDLR